MKNKVLTVAILGVGSRGGDTYGKLLFKNKNFKVVSLCDTRKIRIDQYSKELNVDPKNCFLNENEFFKEKRADVIVISTQDRDHVPQAIKALKLGYDILLEKPITPLKSDCLKLLAAQKKYKHKIMVCHVLRYAPAYVKAAEIIEKGTIGKLVNIEALEQVAYWHQAHSFVRGNWHSSVETSPMIIAKCCHDLDLLQYYANSKCKTVSSFGNLMFFNKANKPKGSAKRCKDCKLIKTCPYSAYLQYIGRWEEAGKPKSMWPQNVVCPSVDLTKERIMKAYENNDYGKCVFDCNNDVVDHQVVAMQFENGISATLTMTAFTQRGGRVYKFHGTYGDLILDEEQQKLILRVFGKKVQELNFNMLVDINGGHGGGDAHLVQDLYDMITGKAKAKTSLESSIESHLMGFAAEESRLNNGKNITIHK